VRGGLIDLFPMGSAVPYRVDLFDDEIDSIRTFDPDSQRSLYPVPEVRLLPGREFPMDDARAPSSAAAGASCSKATRPRAASTRTSATAWPPPASSTTCRCSSTRPPPSSTTWAPTPRWCCTATWSRRFQHFWQDTKERYRLLQGDPERPVLPPEALFLGIEPFFARANATPSWPCAAGGRAARLGPEAADLTVDRGADEPLARLQAHLRSTPHRVLLLAESDGRREKPARASCAPAASAAQLRLAGRVPGQR
jgi:transcription-repair coupling factor (superfamily II helicase)